MSGSSIAVISSPSIASTAGLAAAVAVAVARFERQSCLLIELVDDADSVRPPTLLASAGARGIEERLREAGVDSAARGHICVVSVTPERWEEDGAVQLIALADPGRTVLSLGSEAVSSRLDDLGSSLIGCLAIVDLPRERSLAALLVREMSERGCSTKVARQQPSLIASRRALAGVPPGGASEVFSERVARRFCRASDTRQSPG